MIKLDDLIRNLESGVLFQNYMVDEGTLKNEYMEVIKMHINSAIVDIHTRLPLNIDLLTLVLLDDVDTYQLVTDFNIVNGSDVVSPEKRFIDDSKNNFDGNLLKIIDVFDDFECNVPLNVLNSDYTVITPTYDRIQLRDKRKNISERTSKLIIKYQKHCNLIPDDMSCSSAFNIDMPPYMLDVINLYVKSRIYSSLHVEGALQDSESTFLRYEQEIQKIKVSTLINQGTWENMNLEKQGFV